MMSIGNSKGYRLALLVLVFFMFLASILPFLSLKIAKILQFLGVAPPDPPKIHLILAMAIQNYYNTSWPPLNVRSRITTGDGTPSEITLRMLRSNCTKFGVLDQHVMILLKNLMY